MNRLYCLSIRAALSIYRAVNWAMDTGENALLCFMSLATIGFVWGLCAHVVRHGFNHGPSVAIHDWPYSIAVGFLVFLVAVLGVCALMAFLFSFIPWAWEKLGEWLRSQRDECAGGGR